MKTSTRRRRHDAGRLTMWVNDVTGQRLSVTELRDARHRAHRAYQANVHIFEDEAEALTALGVLPMGRV